MSGCCRVATSAAARSSTSSLDLHVLDQYGELIAAQAREQARVRRPRLRRRSAIACSTRSPKLWPSVSLIDLKLSRSTNSSATRWSLAAARVSAAASRVRELAAVGQLGERVVMRQMVQLLRALGDVPLELGLVGAQLRLGARDLVGHGVEGFRQAHRFRPIRRAARARRDCRRPTGGWPRSAGAPAR